MSQNQNNHKDECEKCRQAYEEGFHDGQNAYNDPETLNNAKKD